MSSIHRFAGAAERYRWEHVIVEPYAVADTGAGTRQVLIGPADGAANFALRYFELAPGTTSQLDVHGHDHGVLIGVSSGLFAVCSCPWWCGVT